MLRGLARRALVHFGRRAVFGRRTRRALICYVASPFLPLLNRRRHHSNFQEVIVLASELDRLGFQVDVVDYRSTPFRGEYDLVIGFGPALESTFFNPSPAIRILYATGSYGEYQNMRSAEQLRLFRTKFGLMFPESCRFNPDALPMQHQFSDAIFAIGNEHTLSTFPPALPSDRRFTLPATYFDSQRVDLDKDWDQAKRRFVWFGGRGAIHKGLPPLLEAFKDRPDLHLTVCGIGREEANFVSFMRNRYLVSSANIEFIDFVTVGSPEFARLVSGSGFAVLPSCSEGQASSVINLVANGALIPVVTRACGLDVDDFGFLIPDGNLYEQLPKVLRVCCEESPDTLRRMSEIGRDFVRRSNSLDAYRAALRRALASVLKEGVDHAL